MGSVFWVYQKLIQKRKEKPVFSEGSFQLLLEEDEHIFAYKRVLGEEEMLVCGNFTGEKVICKGLEEWDRTEIPVHNYPRMPGKELRPYEAFIRFRTRKQ